MCLKIKYKTSHLAFFFFFFAICLLLYFNALNNNFIFDDNFLIVDNAYIKNISSIAKLFKTDIFHFQHPEDPSAGTYYRPLQALSHSIDYFFWKLNPSGHRLTNIFIHSINSFLLFLLIYLIFKNKILALLSGTFFCLHPMQVFNVAIISARSSLLEVLFMLLSLIAFIHYSVQQKKVHYALSLLSFILALFSREGALLLPLFIIICAIFLAIDKKRIIVYVIPYIFIGIFYLGFRVKFIPCDKFNLTNIFTLETVSSFIWFIQEYIRQLILPIGFQVTLFAKSILFKFILFFLTSILIVYALIKSIILKDRIVIFASAFYLIGLLPVIRLIDTINCFGRILSEHYLYMPSIGFCILISYLILKLHSRFRKIATVCIISIIFIYSSLTIINNPNYKDELTFYNHILNVDEEHSFIRVNLGVVYNKKQMYEEAIKQAKFVLTKDRAAWDAYLLLGNVHKSKGDLDKAMQFYKKAIILYPRSSEAFNNIGLIYKEQDNNEEAYNNFRKALELNPESFEVFNNLGLIYKEQGKDEQAYNSFKKALELNPESLPILKNLTDSFMKKRLYQEAILVCEKILQLNPVDIDARLRMGIIWAELGYFKKAEVVFKEALRIDSTSVDAMRNLAALYGNSQKFDQAISMWERVFQINPDDQEARKNIEQARKIRGY